MAKKNSLLSDDDMPELIMMPALEESVIVIQTASQTSNNNDRITITRERDLYLLERDLITREQDLEPTIRERIRWEIITDGMQQHHHMRPPWSPNQSGHTHEV